MLYADVPTAVNMSQFDSAVVFVQGALFETYVLTALGSVYGCGKRFASSLLKPLVVPVPMVEMAVGGAHILLRDAQGNVYSYGTNTYAKLE